MAIGESEPAAISMSHFGAGMRSVVGFNFEFARQKQVAWLMRLQDHFRSAREFRNER
jgi:hypothetical protein